MLILGGLIFFSFTLQVNPGSAALGWHETGPELGCFGPAFVFAEGF